MKTITLIGAKIYVVVYAIELLRHLPIGKLADLQGFSYPAGALYPALFLNALTLLGWIELVRGDKDAWTLLFVFLSMSAIGWAAITFLSPDLPNGSPAERMFVIRHGYLGIPGLVLLLLDRPGRWKVSPEER